MLSSPEDAISEAEQVFARLQKVSRFQRKYGICPHNEVARISTDFYNLSESIPLIENPQTQDELTKAELKRRLQGEAFSMERMLSGIHYDFETVTSIYGIPKEDVAGLRGWLEENRQQALESISRLYSNGGVQEMRVTPNFDIPSVREQSERFCSGELELFHRGLSALLQGKTNVGGVLGKISAEVTYKDRSYFDFHLGQLALSIPSICYQTSGGEIMLDERALIRDYGHEAMGHALNYVLSTGSGLPLFLAGYSAFTQAVMESVANFYQGQIFEDLKEAPGVQEELGIKEGFEAIYNEERDAKLLETYKTKTFMYAIAVLADKSLGRHDDAVALAEKIQRISEVAIDPSFPVSFVEHYRHSFDSQGNLNFELVEELKYCAQPVQRALEEFSKQGIKYDSTGREKIDKALLTGYWTPTGFVQNAALKAKE